MQPANNAIEIYREGVAFRDINAQGIRVSTACLNLASNLSKCVLGKNLNPLDHNTVRQNCPVQEWKNECPGSVRRVQFQQLYRKTVNRRLYTQPELDRYMESKNNFHHYGLIDHRY